MPNAWPVGSAFDIPHAGPLPQFRDLRFLCYLLLDLLWDQGPIVAAGGNFYGVTLMRIEIVFVVTPPFQPGSKPPPPPIPDARSKAEDA